MVENGPSLALVYKSSPDQQLLCFLLDNSQPGFVNRALFQQGALQFKSLAAFSPIEIAI